MTFRVIHKSATSFTLDDSLLINDWTVEDELKTLEDALIVAEVAAIEHSARLDVSYERHGNGFTFITNNGTQVWYNAKENKS